MLPHTTKLEKSLLAKTANSLKAIAHPVRLAMIELLQDGKRLNVTQIYETLGLEQAVASQHLSILKDKNILTSKREGKHTFYFLKHECVIDVITLILSTHDDYEPKKAHR
ncbi:MAG: metalloregulator ArsR/SmtB family transcription factor [Bacteroidota bacterium]